MGAGTETVEAIAGIIREAFSQSLSDYRAEVQEASSTSRINFAPLRPVFISGTPADAIAGEYILFLGLNPKLDVKRTGNTAHYEKIDAGPKENAEVTLGYFDKRERLHRYFGIRAKVVGAFAEKFGEHGASSVAPPGEVCALLRRRAIFCEFVPYHSEKTSGDLRALAQLPNVLRAHRVFRTLIEKHPPAAILLDGVQTWQCLEAETEPVEHRLLNTTKLGECVVKQFRYAGLPVVQCGFIGSQSGVNSIAQRVELGRLLALG